MNSSINTPPASLTSAEEEIAECERIVAFAEQVMAGTHARVKIPPHLLQARQANTKVPPAPVGRHTPKPAINFHHNYYHVLGLEEHVKQDSIDRAYNGRWAEYSPDSELGRAKRESGNINTIRKAEKMYEKVKKAYEILGNPELRKEYDAGRIRDRAPPNDCPIARPTPSRGCGGRGGHVGRGRGRSGRGGRGGRRG